MRNTCEFYANLQPGQVVLYIGPQDPDGGARVVRLEKYRECTFEWTVSDYGMETGEGEYQFDTRQKYIFPCDEAIMNKVGLLRHKIRVANSELHAYTASLKKRFETIV